MTRLPTCFLLAACFAFSAIAQSPLPPGPLSTRNQNWENDIGQIGGKGVGVYQSLKNLRCQSAGDALVGVELTKGTVIDHVRIACAPVNCATTGCSWNFSSWSAPAGNTTGGETKPATICKQNEMISGLRGRAIGIASRGMGFDYAADAEFECAPIVSQPVPSNPRLLAIGLEGRNWRYWGGNITTAPGGKLTKPASCPTFGATGLSVGIGLYLTGSQVIQAMSLLCGVADLCPAGQTYIAQLASIYTGSTGQCRGCCKTCVNLAGSTDPVVGATDRAVAGLAVNTYNCHYYTLTYMNLLTDSTKGRRNPTSFNSANVFGQTLELSSECLQDSDFANYGFSKVQAGSVDPLKLQVGDIVTVYGTAFFSQSCRNAHSGVVIQAGLSQPGYQNVIIRQKPDPFTCVLDFTWAEFQASYGLTGRGYAANAWRRQK